MHQQHFHLNNFHQRSGKLLATKWAVPRHKYICLRVCVLVYVCVSVSSIFRISFEAPHVKSLNIDYNHTHRIAAHCNFHLQRERGRVHEWESKREGAIKREKKETPILASPVSLVSNCYTLARVLWFVYLLSYLLRENLLKYLFYWSVWETADPSVSQSNSIAFACNI